MYRVPCIYRFSIGAAIKFDCNVATSSMRICHASILQYKLENLIEFQIANNILQLDCMQVI